MSDSIRRLSLEENLTIYNAALMKDQLLEALQTCDELELDLSHVAEIDSAGFQLLVMIKRESVRQHKPIRLVEHSAAVRRVLDLYNMAGYFGDPMHIPA